MKSNKNSAGTKRKVHRNKEEKSENGQQKILLKIKAGTSTTFISPGKEVPQENDKKLKSSHVKHKRKKAKRKLDIMQPAVSMKNGLILKIRPVLKPESEQKVLKKRSKSRTKLKHDNSENSEVQQSNGLKLKIRTEQGKGHVVLNSETEQKVPKLLVSKKNLENVHKNLSKLSGSMLTSKNIVRKYKNKKNMLESVVDNDALDLENVTEDVDKPVPRVKNGIIIHKDRLGNYTSAEQIMKTDPKATEGGVGKMDAPERTKTSKSKKHDVPKFAKGFWAVMPSPRPDGTPDLMKIRLSPQKPPPRLETNPDILYETTKLYGMDTRSKTDTALSEDSDTFGASPITEKDLELGINSVHDSGIEVLSSSSCNRSNGNSVRSVLLDENSPTYFHGEDSLMSFDSPGNDSSKYEHSICGKCGGIVMEQNNNTYSPTKCHCDLNSPSQDLQEKAGYIYISPLKDPSSNKKSPKYKLNDKNAVSESPLTVFNGPELCEKTTVNDLNSLFPDNSKIETEKSVFDFNEDEDFAIEKPSLDHVKNPRVLNKTEEEKKQESILLGDLQEPKELATPKKRTRNKLSRSPRRKEAKDTSEKSEIIEESPGRKIGLTPSKPIIIEDESPISKEKELKLMCASKTTGKLSDQKDSLDQEREAKGVDDYGLHLEDKVVSESSKSIIVGIAKNDEIDDKEPKKNKPSRAKMTKDERPRRSRRNQKGSSTDNDETGKSTVCKPGEKYNALKNGNVHDAQKNGTDSYNESEAAEINRDSNMDGADDKNPVSKDQTEKLKDKQDTEKEDMVQVNKKKDKSKDPECNINKNDDDPVLQTFDETSQKLIEYLEAKGMSDEVPVLCSANNDSGIEEIHLYTKGCSKELIKSVESFVKEAEEVTINKNEEVVNLMEDDEEQSPGKNHTSGDLKVKNVEETVSSEDMLKESMQNDNENETNDAHKNENVTESVAQESIVEDTCVQKDEIEKSTEKETIQKSNSEGNIIDKVIEQLESEPELELNESESKKPNQEDATVEMKKIKPPPVVLKDFDEDSLLPAPVPDNTTDLTAALEQAGLGVKTTVPVVMNPDEDDIPEVVSSASAKQSASSIIKSPLDLFQQQFLSFLSHKSPDPEETKPSKRTKRKASSNKMSKPDLKKTPKSAEAVDLISDGSSDSDFELPVPKRKKRQSSFLDDSKVETDNKSKDKGHEKTKANNVTPNLKSNSKADSDCRKNSTNNIIIVKSPNMEDDIQIELPQPDSDSDFEPQTEITVHKKMPFVQKTPNARNLGSSRIKSDINHMKNPQEDSDKDLELSDHEVKPVKKSVVKKGPKSARMKAMHKDFGSDDSDFVISDSELERAGTSDSDFDGSVEPKVKRLKSCRERRESLRQRTISYNEDDENSKDSKDDQQEICDTQTSEKGDRFKRSKRGRKSICPCCIGGSPGIHTREGHEYKPDYKLPKNHKQFVANTIRLLELKAKIHRLFLSLFPDCRELITQSDINTIAFDDLIDDVLSTLKSDIQFEPGSDIFAESAANLSQETPFVPIVDDESFQQVVGETVQQLVDDTVNYESVENDTNSALETDNLSCVVTENSGVVFVPNLQLVYSDDAVLGTSQIPIVDQMPESGATTSANLLPRLPTYSTVEKGVNNSESEDAVKEQTETDDNEKSENNVSNKADKSVVTGENDTFHNADNVNQELTPLVSNNHVLKSDSQVLQTDNQVNYVPLDSSAHVEDIALQNTNDIAADEVFVNNNGVSAEAPTLMSTDPSCSSTEQNPEDMVSEIQTVEGETADLMTETNCEEIVITIDLNAAKVQLCRSPASCLKLLHLKIVRLIWCLLPDLQVSSGVYESLENLEFLLDLIIMSNSSAEENNTLLSKVASKLKTKHSIAKRTEKRSNSLPSINKRGRPPKKHMLRRQSELSVREMIDRKPSRELLKRRTKSTDKAVLLKKLKTSETNSEKKRHKIVQKSPLKHAKSSEMIKLRKSAAISSMRRNSTGKIVQPSKVTDAKIIGAVAKKYSSEKAKAKHSESSNVSMPADKGNVQSSEKRKSMEKERTEAHGVDSSVKTRENRSLFELEFENSIGVTKDSALNGKLEGNLLKATNCVPKAVDRGGNIFERMDSCTTEKSEGNIFEIMDSVTTEVVDLVTPERNNGNIFEKMESVESEMNEKLTSPINVSLSSPVRTPSPEKSVGSISPDLKRRSSDKNIFDLLQES